MVCIFNPVSWGCAVQSDCAAGPGVTQTVGVSDCVDCWPGKGRSKFRLHRLMVVKINTLAYQGGRDLSHLNQMDDIFPLELYECEELYYRMFVLVLL